MKTIRRFIWTMLPNAFERLLARIGASVDAVGRGPALRIQDAEKDDALLALERKIDDAVERFDVTVTKIREDKERVEAILEGLFEAVIVVEADGKVLLMNEVFGSMFDVDPKTARGRRYWEVFRQERMQELIGRALKDKSGVSGDYGMLMPEERHFQVQISPIRGRDQFLGAAVILHDVTTIKKLERMRSEFVANVSHELKTPLSSIIGAADTLKAGAVNDVENRGEFLEMIRVHAEELKTLIDDLLDLAKIESTGSRIDKREEKIGEILDELKRDFERRAREKNLSVVFSSPAGGTVSCNRPKLRQALGNLIANALKYTDAGGRIAVEAAVGGEWVTFAVTDTGIGIAEDDQSRIFERFYRTEKSRSRDAGGTGLGLSIVKHIAEAHGGLVEVESASGAGSTFRIRLPRFSS